MTSAPAPSAPRRAPEPRSAYRAFRSISTRWADNDVYGHVNNVVYYSWFDTAVNAYLIEQGVLDIHAGGTIGLVIETQCNYFAPLAFPQNIEAGIRVARLATVRMCSIVSREIAVGRKARADIRLVMAASTLAASVTAGAVGFWLMGCLLNLR